MKLVKSTYLEPLQKQAACALWNSEYPEKLAHKSLDDFDAYLGKLQNQTHCFLMSDDRQLMGWAFTFVRESDTWFAVIVDSAIHAQGFGTQLLNSLKEDHGRLNGWVIDHNRDFKINGKKYPSPLSFYLKNGFKIVAGTRLETGTISAVKIVWEK